jgi:hypothetical protein
LIAGFSVQIAANVIMNHNTLRIESLQGFWKNLSPSSVCLFGNSFKSLRDVAVLLKQ